MPTSAKGRHSFGLSIQRHPLLLSLNTEVLVHCASTNKGYTHAGARRRRVERLWSVQPIL
jgi:hypothetical protein